MAASSPRSSARAAATLVLALAAGGTAAAVDAQELPDTGRVTIRGRVVDEVTRVPLAGVIVQFEDLGAVVQTDSVGQFEVKGIRVGVHYLSLSRPGYRPSSGEFAVLREGSFITSMVPLNAEADVVAGRFVGRVVDAESGDPLADTDVQIAGLFMGGITDADGRFRMDAVPPGRHPVQFTHLGYASRIDTVDVVSGRTSDARVRLTLDPIEVEPIEVTVERREIGLENVGFYQRRDEGFGEFIDLEIIEQRAPGEMTDLFTRLPGAILVADPYNPLERSVVLRGGRLEGRGRAGGGSTHCYPSVVLDGTIIHRGGETPAQLDKLIEPSAVAGIEVFPSSMGVPVQFGGIDAACGVVVIWTRR